MLPMKSATPTATTTITSGSALDGVAAGVDVPDDAGADAGAEAGAAPPPVPESCCGVSLTERRTKNTRSSPSCSHQEPLFCAPSSNPSTSSFVFSEKKERKVVSSSTLISVSSMKVSLEMFCPERSATICLSAVTSATRFAFFLAEKPDSVVMP